MDERVLVVEDDRAMAELASLVLERAGMRVACEFDGRRGLDRFRTEPFDLVVLDVMLPFLDGFEVCREIRRSSRVPIVMLTARTDTADVVAGLELGADDYVTKPFEAPELQARVRSVLRRAAPGGPEEPVVVVDDVEIDPGAFRVTKRGAPVALSATEFPLLLELASHPGRIFTREVLLERVWNADYLADSRLVDMAVKRLRDKVEDFPGEPRLIATVRGVGYRLDLPGRPRG